jgi:hypothetical protein
LRLGGEKMKLPFSKREPTTLRERLLEAIERGLKANRVLFASLGEGLYVHVMPPVYDFFAQRERFDREAAEARKALLGDEPLGRYALINFREIRDDKSPYADDYQVWAGKHAIKLAGDLGLVFLVREKEVRQVIAQECERAGLTCEPTGQWDMRVHQIARGPGIPMPGEHIIYTGDLVYEAIGRARNLSELVREYLAYNIR